MGIYDILNHLQIIQSSIELFNVFCSNLNLGFVAMLSTDMWREFEEIVLLAFHSQIADFFDILRMLNLID